MSKLEYYDIDGKQFSLSVLSFIYNFIFYSFFEIIILIIKGKILEPMLQNINGLVCDIIDGIIIFQAIGLISLIAYISFRQKGVFLCNDYIEIKDGILLFRLLYRRKIYYEDIIDCQIIKPYNIHARVTKHILMTVALNFLVSNTIQFSPFQSSENNKIAIEITTYNSKQIILAVEKQEQFLKSVNQRINKTQGE